MDIETYIVKKANEFARSNEKRMKITKYIAKYGHLLFVIYGAVYFLLPGRTQRERRKNCISILVSICISSIISFFIGKKFYRNRPFVKDIDVSFERKSTVFKNVGTDLACNVRFTCFCRNTLYKRLGGRSIYCKRGI